VDELRLDVTRKSIFSCYGWYQTMVRMVHTWKAGDDLLVGTTSWAQSIVGP
jgi:hypothetical protein